MFADPPIRNLNGPKVSVVTASYNHSKFLADAIASLETQTYPDWELIIVDDASTDLENDRVMEEARNRNPGKIKILKNETNINNISVSWNRALDMISGEYISFLDNDNRKRPDFIGKMAKYLDEHEKDLAVGCYNQMIDAQGKSISGIHDAASRITRTSILEENKVDSGELMVRRTAIERVGYFDERCLLSEDWDMIIRLVFTGSIGVIPEALAEYRCHSENRMHSKVVPLDEEYKFVDHVRNKNRFLELSIYLLFPLDVNLTESQKQVCRGVYDGINQIDWVKVYSSDIDEIDSNKISKSDLIVVVAPFQVPIEVMEDLSKFNIPILTSHMEDPAAVKTNLERTNFAQWVVTNDISTFPLYRKQQCEILGEGTANRVLFVPSLSINANRLSKKDYDSVEKKYDVVICGYAYESRKEFLRSVIDKIDFKLLVIGDGWCDSGINVDFINTMPEEKTFKFYQQSRIIACVHRTNSDVGGNSDLLRPESLTRGFIEAYSGAMVIVDNDRRAIPPFAQNEIVIYDRNNPQDFIDKIHYYLEHGEERLAIAIRTKKRAEQEFTFKTRWTKILNCFRSERYGMEIP